MLIWALSRPTQLNFMRWKSLNTGLLCIQLFAYSSCTWSFLLISKEHKIKFCNKFPVENLCSQNKRNAWNQVLYYQQKQKWNTFPWCFRWSNEGARDAVISCSITAFSSFETSGGVSSFACFSCVLQNSKHKRLNFKYFVCTRLHCLINSAQSDSEKDEE